MQLQLIDILLIVFGIVVVAAGGLYFLNRWSSTKMVEQQKMIDQTKQSMTLFIIDKKKVKPQEASLPKIVSDNMPKRSRFLKAPFVRAKVGAQIMTFMCDPRVYDALPIQKQVKAEVAGIYIVDFKGRKSEEEIKAQRKAKGGGFFASLPNPFKRG